MTFVGAVVVAGQQDHGFFAAGEIPEARQRLLIQVHAFDQFHQQPLLLICLRDGHLVEVHPVRLRIPGGVPIEQIVRADGRAVRPVPALPRRGCPGGYRRPSEPGRR